MDLPTLTRAAEIIECKQCFTFTCTCTCTCRVLFPADGKGASAAQVSSHQQQKAERDRWRADCDGLQDVLFNLERTYQTHKGDFALGRYEELKDMVKSAVSQSQTIVQVSPATVSPPVIST